jgi:hypothetical protein
MINNSKTQTNCIVWVFVFKYFTLMKKLLTLIFFALLFASCSSDSDSDSASTSGILLQKIIRQNENGTTTTMTYVYNGKKMLTFGDGTISYKVFYNGNLVTKIESYNLNNLMSIFYFTYDSSEKLVQYKLDSPNLLRVWRNTYVYNNDNTISVSQYDAFDGGTETLQTQKYFLDSEGEIIRIEKYNGTNTAITLYTYDTKNNPFRNVVGFDKLLNIIGQGIWRNTITTDEIDFDGTSSRSERIMTYNAQDFLLTSQFEGSSTIESYYY